VPPDVRDGREAAKSRCLRTASNCPPGDVTPRGCAAGFVDRQGVDTEVVAAAGDGSARRCVQSHVPVLAVKVAPWLSSSPSH